MGGREVLDDRPVQDPFHTGERPDLIGEPLSQSFSVQFDVPMDDHRVIGRDDGPYLVRGHVEIPEDPDHQAVCTSLRPGPTVDGRARKGMAWIVSYRHRLSTAIHRAAARIGGVRMSGRDR